MVEHNIITDESLRISRENLSQAAKLAHLGPWNYNMEIDLFEFSDDFYAIYGTDAEREGLFMSREMYLREFVPPEDAYIVQSDVQAALATEEKYFSIQLEHRIIRRDGAIRNVAVRINVIRDDDRKIIQWYGVNQDITEYKVMATAIQVSKEKLSLAAELAHLAPWNYDVETNLFEFDKEFYVIYGTDVAREGLTMAPDVYAREFLHPDDAWVVKMELEKSFLSTERHYSAQLEHRIIRRDGEVRTIAVKINVLRDDAGKIVKYYGANQDITERKRSEEELAKKNEELFAINQRLQQEIFDRVQAENQLKYFIFHDNLTGLFNRFYFEEEMCRLSSGRFLPISIVVADVDGLKLVNDVLGHQAGDVLIQRAAELLRRNFRGSDAVARVGGDEFAVILPQTDKNVIERIFERIELALSDNTDTDIPLLISLGFAMSTSPSTNMEELYHQADRNMYLNKRKRRQISFRRLSAFLKDKRK